MESRWWHFLCNRCWKERNPGKQPAQFKMPVNRECCGCGKTTASGIYQRIDPETMRCKGNHLSMFEITKHLLPREQEAVDSC